jgi:predicted Zn finger-like uncharacterized protein
MSSVRLRRLQADREKLQEYVRRHPRVRLVQMEGDPPERYQVEYRINSLRMTGGELQSVQSHLVEITLPRSYPRLPPQCRMLTPVFHPNIAPHAICVGDHWGAGESLESIIVRIGEMLAYQSYNVKSPLNGEAARWVEENKHRVPLDTVSLLPEEGASNAGLQTKNHKAANVIERAGTSPPASNVAATSSNQMRINCPHCAAVYQVSAAFLGRKVRCKCGQSFTCTTDSDAGFGRIDPND